MRRRGGGARQGGAQRSRTRGVSKPASGRDRHQGRGKPRGRGKNGTDEIEGFQQSSEDDEQVKVVQPMGRRLSVSRGKGKSAKEKKERKEEEEKEMEREAAATRHAHLEETQKKEQLDVIQERIDAALARAVNHGEMPPVQLLTDLASVLRKHPVHVAVGALPKAPRLLLLAARRGASMHGGAGGLACTAVSNALVALARGIAETGNADSEGIAARRQPAVAPADVEAAHRAGKWAIGLLTSCVRGDGGDDRSITPHKFIEHADATTLFVCPRDMLDSVMAKQLVSNIVQRLSILPSSAPRAAIVVYRICEHLHGLLDVPCVKPALEAILSAASRLLVPLEVDHGEDFLGGSCGPLPERFVRDLAVARTNGVFDSMTIRSRSAVIRLSTEAWAEEMRRVQAFFVETPWIAVEDEARATAALADAAAFDVCLHWEVMDNARAALSATSEPFSIRSWKERRCARALLSQIVRVVGSYRDENTVDATVLLKVAPIARRFGAAVRPLATSVTVLGFAIEESGMQDGAAGAAGVSAVCRALDEFCAQEDGRLPEDLQAVLLCLEGALENICWSCAAGLTKSRLKTDGAAGPQQLCMLLSRVVLAVDTVRLPGSLCSESKEASLARARRLSCALMGLFAGQRVMPGFFGSAEASSGLLAMTLAGAVCNGREVSELVTNDKGWNMELARALNKACILVRTGTLKAIAHASFQDVCVRLGIDHAKNEQAPED